MSHSKEKDEQKRKMTEKYFDTVYRLALSQTRNREYADDVLQEVFLRYIKTDRTFENEEHIKAWLIRVTVNCSKKLFTSSWFKKSAPLTEDIPFEDPEVSDLYNKVCSLPVKYRTVIHLFYYEDMTVAQIAGCTGSNENTVKSQLHRGRQLLKGMLKGGQEYEF